MGTGYERPGRGVYVTATAALVHGDLTVQNGMVGSVIKQKAWTSDQAKNTRKNVDIGERFFLRTKGIAEAETAVGKQGNGIAAAAVGSTVYIADGTGADARGLLFAAAAAGRSKLGRVHAIAGVHGCPPGIIRIDMDTKDSFV